MAPLLLVTVTIPVPVPAARALLLFLLLFLLLLATLLLVLVILLPVAITITITVLLTVFVLGSRFRRGSCPLLLVVPPVVTFTTTAAAATTLPVSLRFLLFRLILLWVSFLFLRSGCLSLLFLGWLPQPSRATTTTKSPRQPSLHCAATLYIDHDSSGVNLLPVSLLVSILQVSLVLILNKGISSGLPLQVIDHPHTLDATKDLKLPLELLFRRVVADARDKQGLEGIAACVWILVWIVLVNKCLQLVLVSLQLLLVSPFLPLLRRLP
mmetsp:Transcript_21309/g.38956  ORF Transcript_21309/g.38956 Transcript_21309/m.38956 type:complete len:268 (+) Transcript_21309:103-906(+)